MKSAEFGKPVSQTSIDIPANELSIKVDSENFVAATLFTYYDNAVEYAIVAPDGLRDALSREPTVLQARLGNFHTDLGFAGAEGFKAAIQCARAHCD